MARAKPFKLMMNLTPQFMSHVNIYSVAPEIWPAIRKGLLRERGPVCEICGFVAQERRLIDAHEKFKYLANSVLLIGIQLLCKRCHDCTHFDHLLRLETAGIRGQGRGELIVEHFCSINECSRTAFDEHYAASQLRRFELQERFGANISLKQVRWGPYQEKVAPPSRAANSAARGSRTS
jgi:hypothetical protein